MEDTHNGASNHHQPPKPEEESVEKQQPRLISTALDPLMHVWFNRLRNTEHSRVCSGLEFLAAMTLVGSSSKDDDPPPKSSSREFDFHDRLGACFDLFDFEHSGNLDMDVVTLLLKTSLQGLRKTTKGFSDDDSMNFELESLRRRLQDLVHKTCEKDDSSSSSKDIVTTEEEHQKTTNDDDRDDDDDDPQVHRRRRRRRSRASSSPDQVSRPSTHQRLKKQDFVHFILTCAEMQPILSKLRQIHDPSTPQRRDREKSFRNNTNQRETEESHVDFHIDHHSSSSIATTKCRTKNERKLMAEIQELQKACLRSEEQLKTMQLELEREQQLRRQQHHHHQEEEEGLEVQQVTAETPTMMPKSLERTTTIKQDHNDPRSTFQYEKALIQFQAIVRGVTLRKNARRFVQALVLIQSHFRGRRSRQDFYQRPKIEKILGFRLVKGTCVIEFDIQWQDTKSSVEDETTPGTRHRSYYSTKNALKWTHERKIVECYELEHQDEIQKMMPIAVSMYPECRKTLAPQPEEDEPEPATTPEIEEDIREEEEECEVELIVDHRLIEDETLEYRVHWAGGSSPDEDEWFSREDLVDAGGNTPILLHTYENDHHLELHQWL